MNNKEKQDKQKIIPVGTYCRVLFEESPFFDCVGEVKRLIIPKNEGLFAISKPDWIVYEIEVGFEQKQTAFFLGCFLLADEW